MFNALGTFVLGILKRIYLLAPSLLSDPFDISERWFLINYDAPQWLFWCLLGSGLFIAVFLTYYDVKRKLDEIGEEFYFEPTGMDVTTKTGEVLINATFRAKPSVIIGQLYLEIDGSRFEPSKWKPFVVSPQYTDTWTYKLGETIKHETKIGKLIAKIGKKDYESRDFDVHT